MLDLTERDRAFIIAEAGTNHAYRVDWLRPTNAYYQVATAKDCGADAIKFQIFNAPIEISKFKPNDFFCWIDGDEERVARWEMSYLPLDSWRNVKKFADDLGIMFLASVFQHSTVEWLNELGVEATKVASRAAKGFPYGKSPEPYLISDGMYEPYEWPFPNSMKWYGFKCEANYPSKAVWYADDSTGFSDHSGTPWRAIDAISKGCKLIEVHFYINEEDAGPDLPASLSLDELKLVCDARDGFAEIRNA